MGFRIPVPKGTSFQSFGAHTEKACSPYFVKREISSLRRLFLMVRIPKFFVLFLGSCKIWWTRRQRDLNRNTTTTRFELTYSQVKPYWKWCGHSSYIPSGVWLSRLWLFLLLLFLLLLCSRRWNSTCHTLSTTFFNVFLDNSMKI